MGNVIKNHWKHPLKDAPADFMDELDQVDPLICSRASLERLKKLAPTEEIAAYLCGILDLRTVNAIVTEKEF
jgi:hypothetical protein